MTSFIRQVELYLVRHGETTANRDNILQGAVCDYSACAVNLLFFDNIIMLILIGI